MESFCTVPNVSSNPLTYARRCAAGKVQSEVQKLELLTIIQKDIDAIRKFVSPHPLALFLQSHVFRQLGLNDQAIEVFGTAS